MDDGWGKVLMGGGGKGANAAGKSEGERVGEALEEGDSQLVDVSLQGDSLQGDSLVRGLSPPLRELGKLNMRFSRV